MILQRLTVETYEESVGDAYPVVIHAFIGRTKEEAMGYYKAHLTTDTFFSACEKTGRFRTIECRNQGRWDEVEIE